MWDVRIGKGQIIRVILYVYTFFFVIQVTVLRMVDLDDSEDSSEENEDKIMPPKPTACAKVQHVD